MNSWLSHYTPHFHSFKSCKADSSRAALSPVGDNSKPNLWTILSQGHSIYSKPQMGSENLLKSNCLVLLSTNWHGHAKRQDIARGVALYKNTILLAIRRVAERTQQQLGGKIQCHETSLCPRCGWGRTGIKGQHYLSFFFLFLLHKQGN